MIVQSDNREKEIPFPSFPTKVNKVKVNFYNSTKLSLPVQNIPLSPVYFYKYAKTLLDMLLEKIKRLCENITLHCKQRIFFFMIVQMQGKNMYCFVIIAKASPKSLVQGNKEGINKPHFKWRDISFKLNFISKCLFLLLLASDLP